jgi:hypothetical protein
MSGVKSMAYAITTMAALSTIVLAGCKNDDLLTAPLAPVGPSGASLGVTIPAEASLAEAAVDQEGKPAVLTVAGEGGVASLKVEAGADTGLLVRNTDIEANAPTQSYSNGTNALTVSKDAGSDRLLTDVSYGVYDVHNADGSRQVGSYHYGNITPQDSRPTGNVTATYAGKFTGVEVMDGRQRADEAKAEAESQFGPPTVRGLNGDVALVADFGRGTVQGLVGNMKYTDGRRTEPEAEAAALMAREPTATPYGLRMDAQMTGSTYKGTASFTGVENAVTVTNSAVNGAFYGANAAETAGTLSVSGQANRTKLEEYKLAEQPAVPRVVVTGAFGGAKSDSIAPFPVPTPGDIKK